jgi:predicted HTH domain antitoxin
MASQSSQPAFDWPTQEKAAELLGTTVRTIQRMVSERKIASRLQPVSGRKPVVLIDPADIERVLSERRRTVVLPAVSNDPGGKLIAPSEPSREQWKVLTTLLGIQATSQQKPFMDLDTAAEYSGLPIRMLRRLIREDKLPGCRFSRTWYVKRENLDGIDFELACENR